MTSWQFLILGVSLLALNYHTCDISLTGLDLASFVPDIQFIF